jgi:hypothetical protein
MESMESHKAGFPPFPHPLEIPAGFPHYHGYGDDYHVSEDRQSPPKTRNRSHSHRKGLVNHVPGLKRKGCPGTLSASLDELRSEYLPLTEERPHTRAYIASIDGVDIGYVQAYHAMQAGDG